MNQQLGHPFEPSGWYEHILAHFVSLISISPLTMPKNVWNVTPGTWKHLVRIWSVKCSFLGKWGSQEWRRRDTLEHLLHMRHLIYVISHFPNTLWIGHKHPDEIEAHVDYPPTGPNHKKDKKGDLNSGHLKQCPGSFYPTKSSCHNFLTYKPITCFIRKTIH